MHCLKLKIYKDPKTTVEKSQNNALISRFQAPASSLLSPYPLPPTPSPLSLSEPLLSSPAPSFPLTSASYISFKKFVFASKSNR